MRDRLKPEGGSTVVGTFGFMAPEQFQGRAAPASDVYAVAATALSLLSGSEPEDLPHMGLAIDVDAALRGQVDRKLIAALRSMLEPDPDRRATSVDAALREAGLLEAPQSSAASGARGAKRARAERLDAESFRGDGEDVRDDWESWGNRVGKKAERRARKAARKAERRARRMANWHGPTRPVPPGVVLGLFLLLVFRVAAIATFALFQVFLPVLFTLLSVVGGRSMVQRRRRMIEIGQSGQRGLERAAQHIRHQFLGGPEPAVLPEPEPPAPNARVRVADERDVEQEIEEQIERKLEDLAARFERRR